MQNTILIIILSKGFIKLQCSNYIVYRCTLPGFTREYYVHILRVRKTVINCTNSERLKYYYCIKKFVKSFDRFFLS